MSSITGKQLIRLLQKDSYVVKRKAKHGVRMDKHLLTGRTIVITVPNKSKPLPEGTLSAILGAKQTGLGKKGLKELIKKHGLK